MKRIGDKIDEFMEVELEAHPEQVGRFFERVQANYDEAIRNATRFFLRMRAAWFMTYAIHEEWIREVKWVSFEFNRKMTVAAPFLIGLLSYGMFSALAGAILFWEAIIGRLRYTLPKAWEHHLDSFLAPPTFSNVERMLEPVTAGRRPSVYFSRAWFFLVTLMMFGGGLAGIAHTASLLLTSGVVHKAIIATSTAMGLVAWLRGTVLAVSAIKATGGYDLTHQRGARTTPSPGQRPEESQPAPPGPSAPGPHPGVRLEVAPAPVYRRVRLPDVRRAGALIVVERKKRRG